jgi:SPRY domain
VHVGAYTIDDDLSIFRLVISSIVDSESFNKQCQQLDSATRENLTTRLDYYQVNININRQYRAHDKLIVENNIFYIKVAISTNYFYCASRMIWDSSVHKYNVTVNKSEDMRFHIGFAPSKQFDVSKSNYDSCGWYIFLNNGTLYSQNGDNCKPYSSGFNKGDTLTCIYNAFTSEISFEMNGVSLGVAFTDVNGEDIAPAVELYDGGDSITLTSID